MKVGYYLKEFMIVLLMKSLLILEDFKPPTDAHASAKN